MNQKQRITLIRGDGIGPEITDAVLSILDAAKVELEYEEAIVGEQIYHKNVSSGIDDDAWKIIRRNIVMLKAPITTPMGGGYKSLNVTMRKELGLYVNLRPTITYYPIIENSPKKMDLVIVRENEEDLYAGIEYRQTNDSFTSLKLLTKAGSLKICHFAFEYAVRHKRKKVTCMIKDNIMKITDGMFYQAFLEVAAHYPQIENERYIVDIGAARLACRPEAFDVVVTENLYGDIISDVTSEVAGSVGLAGSANYGEKYAMFEAIHGSAPLMAGKNTANPTAFLNGAILMLEYLDMADKANLIKNALFKTLEDGMHTKDLYKEATSKAKLGTKEFAQAIIDRLGQKPNILKADSEVTLSWSDYKFEIEKYAKFAEADRNNKKLVGVDLFFDRNIISPNELAAKIEKAMEIDVAIYNLKGGKVKNAIKLSAIMSRGLKVWPCETEKIVKNCDHWMCRFFINDLENISVEIYELINALIMVFGSEELYAIKMEKLFNFGDVPGFSMGQGE